MCLADGFCHAPGERCDDVLKQSTVLTRQAACLDKKTIRVSGGRREGEGKDSDFPQLVPLQVTLHI